MTCFLPIKQQTQSVSASHVSLGPTTSSQKPSKTALVSSRRCRRAEMVSHDFMLQLLPPPASATRRWDSALSAAKIPRWAENQSINQSPLEPRAHRTARRSLKANSSLQTHSHLGYSIVVAVASTSSILSRRFVTPAAAHDVVAA
jgi:hypothetical protein